MHYRNKKIFLLLLLASGSNILARSHRSRGYKNVQSSKKSTTQTKSVKNLETGERNFPASKFIVNRKSSEPFISGDSFRALADHLFDETSKDINPNNIKHGDVIFVKTDYKDEFFKNIHPRIASSYILITHNADDSAPGECYQYLNDSKIIAWFGTNPDARHLKFFPIPIGIANQMWEHGNVEHFDTAIKIETEKQHLMGMNINVGTNQSVRSRVYNLFKDCDICKNLSDSNHINYLLKMKSAEFILSPEGNGLDCHRTWEALLVGAIPIVRTSYLDDVFYDMPVLIINDWPEVTEELLKQKLQFFKENKFNSDKIFFDYWKNLILQKKKE